MTLTDIRTVDAAESKPYIQHVGALYEQLQRVKESEDGPPTSRRGSDPNILLEGHEDTRKADGQPYSYRTRNGSVVSMTSATSQNENPPHRRGSGSSSRKGHHGSPPLSTIPSVYFDQDFHLENPRIFDIVSERSDVVPQTWTKQMSEETPMAPRRSLATNAILQEKLSWYMDTVEVHLTDSISMASTPFFSVLGSLKEFHLEAAESVRRIQTLRKHLALLDENVVMRRMELSQKLQKRHNLQHLNDAILQLKRVVDGLAFCESLVDEGAAGKALDEIDAIERLMAGERDEALRDETTQARLRDMRGVTMLQGVVSDLTTLRSRIGRIYESKVHSLLIEDLQRHIQSVSPRDVLSRWEASSRRAKGVHARDASAFPAYLSVTDELRTALAPNIHGLHRSRFISTAIQAYREAVLRETRNMVRKPLPSSTEDDESVMSGSTFSGGRGRTSQEKSSILARNIRALDAEDAEALFVTIYISVAETLRRLKTQSGLLLDIACAVENSVGDKSVKPPVTVAGVLEAQEEMHAALDLPNLLDQAVDVSHEKINKILQVRSEQTMSLPLAYFLRYFTLNLFFAHEREAISGRTGTSLKTAVDSHIKGFIKAQRDGEITTLVQGMGADKWQDKDLSAKDVQLLEQVLECSSSDPPMWTEPSKIWAPLSLDEAVEMDGQDLSETNGTVGDKTRGASIEEETFLLPSSAILCLRGVTRFLHLIARVPSMTPDVTTSLILYVQTFDSRCRQLVLGAGAMRSAKLKNITTKHLALTSRALSFIVTIIPYIREFVRRHTLAGPAAVNLAEFDKVRRSLQEQQDSIYQKMVEIMESRARTLARRARDTDWGVEGAEDPRKYMVDLATDTGKLYKALSKYLPEGTVVMVMTRVFASYKDQLERVFRKADPVSEIGCNW